MRIARVAQRDGINLIDVPRDECREGVLGIVIDVFTHSAAYYPVPVLYPITMRAFDGVAWNTPWFIALNYVALGATYLWLVRTRQSDPGR